MKTKEKIKISEVGPRDGLQNEKALIPTDFKIHWIQSLAESGLNCLEITSFVKKEAIPQLADSVEVSKSILPLLPHSQISCLTPNRKGYETAKELGFQEVAVFTASSESFTKKNINRTIAESLEQFQEVTRLASQDGIQVRGYISTVVACPYEGWISPSAVLDVAKALADQGVYEISLGDTIGKGTPLQISKLLEVLLKEFPPSFFAGHFHDTYGTALANVVTALDFGIRSFDSSAGGLGGCPYAKGASGNLATEDLVYLLEGMGYETGVNLEKLVNSSREMEIQLGRKLNSKVYQAVEQKSKDKESHHGKE